MKISRISPVLEIAKDNRNADKELAKSKGKDRKFEDILKKESVK